MKLLRSESNSKAKSVNLSYSFSSLNKENKVLKQLLSNANEERKRLVLMWESLTSFTQASETERLQYQHELNNIKVIIDKQRNSIIKLTEDKRLGELDKEIIGNQLKNLYKAIESLSSK